MIRKVFASLSRHRGCAGFEHTRSSRSEISLQLQAEWGRPATLKEVALIHEMLSNRRNLALINSGLALGALSTCWTRTRPGSCEVVLLLEGSDQQISTVSDGRSLLTICMHPPTAACQVRT